MELLVTYDISTTTPEGVRRLRQVAKACEGIGVRVQQSVFELTVSEMELAKITYGLRRLINPKTDSVRFYRLLAGSFTNAGHEGAATNAHHRRDFVL